MIRCALLNLTALALAGCVSPVVQVTKSTTKHAHGAFISRGMASYYGGGEKLNRYTANGEVFRPWARTAAHRSLPFGTILNVTNTATGQDCTVRINDRGPAAWTGRIIDLSRGSAAACGIHGVAHVELAKGE